MNVRERTLADGKTIIYLARWWDPHKRKIRSKAFLRKRAAEVYAAEMKVKLARRTYVDPDKAKMKIADWGQEWFDSLDPDDYKPKTLEGYESLWRSQVRRYWGEWSLGDIKPIDVQKWTIELKRHGLSDSRVHQTRQLMGMIMNAAVENDYIAKSPVGREGRRRIRPRPRGS